MSAEAKPLLIQALPDLVEEIAWLLRGAGAGELEGQLRVLRIEALCDCGDPECASFATAAEVVVARNVELAAPEGHLIVDLDAADHICFIEVLGRPDVRYLLEEFYAADGAARS